MQTKLKNPNCRIILIHTKKTLWMECIEEKKKAVLESFKHVRVYTSSIKH